MMEKHKLQLCVGEMYIKKFHLNNSIYIESVQTLY